MSTYRESSVRKTRDELLEEYSRLTNTDLVMLKSQMFRKSNKCIENMAKEKGISIFKRIYVSTIRTYKVEILQNGEVISTFTVESDRVEKGIKKKTGYKVVIEETEPNKADMRVTIEKSETRLNIQTPKVQHYRIVMAYKRKGRSYEEIDWKTGEPVEI